MAERSRERRKEDGRNTKFRIIGRRRSPRNNIFVRVGKKYIYRLGGSDVPETQKGEKDLTPRAQPAYEKKEKNSRENLKKK